MICFCSMLRVPCSMIKELHKRLTKKEISARELVQEYFNIIEEKNEDLNVFLDVYGPEALKRAELVDKKIKKGEKIDLLEGIPFAVKDNMCVAGRRTSAASKILDNHIAAYNATVIDKLYAKGAILLGKTNLDEYAMGASTENSAFGAVKNPHDKTRVAGGSSGGSGAAVAAGMVPWSLGSDTGGSIRNPASFCGIVGFKPTYGRISRYGLIAMASSYDQIGPLAKSVEDAEIVYKAIRGKDIADNTSLAKKASRKGGASLKGIKLGIIKEFFETEGLDPKVKEIIEERIEWAGGQGAEILEVEVPHIKHSLAVYYIMMPSEVSSNLARFDGIRYGFSQQDKAKDLLDVYRLSRAMALGDEPKRRIILGTYALSAGYYDAYYKKAQQVREVIKGEIKKAFKKVDFIVSPVMPTPAFKIGDKANDPLQMYLADIYTTTANVAMIPAISVPAGMARQDGKSLPVGLQLMGKWWEDIRLLNVAKKFEIK